MEEIARLSIRLADDTAIVEEAHFEGVIFRIWCGGEHTLSRPEERAMSHLLFTNTDTDYDTAICFLASSLAADIKKRTKLLSTPMVPSM